MRFYAGLASVLLAVAPVLQAGDLLFPPPDSTLRLETGELTRIPLADPVAVGRIVWVLPYTLINESDADRSVTIAFSMSTDAKRWVELPGAQDAEGPGTLAPRHAFSPVKVRAVDVPEARAKIGQILGAQFLSHAAMQGPIRAGERKSGAAVFSDVPVDVHTLQVHVFGLSPVQTAVVDREERGFRRGIVNPDVLKRYLAAGIPVVRLASEPGGDGVEFLPLVGKLSARDYAAVMKQPGAEFQVFERDGAYYRYADPLFEAADGDRILQQWVLRITFERVNEAARGVADYTVQTKRNWILGLSEEKPPQ